MTPPPFVFFSSESMGEKKRKCEKMREREIIIIIKREKKGKIKKGEYHPEPMFLNQIGAPYDGSD